MRTGDEEWVDAYIKTLSGEPDMELAPRGYGLTVIDYMTNHFLTMQGYCGYDYFSELDGFGTFKESMHEIFRENAEAGLLTAKFYVNTNTEILEHLPAETAMQRAAEIYEEFWGRKNRDLERKYNVVKFMIDLKPMTYISFDEYSEGCREFRKKLIELGFNLLLEDEVAWMRVIAEYVADEEEDQEDA